MYFQEFSSSPKSFYFYWLNLGALWFIRIAEFSTIKFYTISIISSCSNTRERVDVRRPVLSILILLPKSTEFSFLSKCQTLLYIPWSSSSQLCYPLLSIISTLHLWIQEQSWINGTKGASELHWYWLESYDSC